MVTLEEKRGTKREREEGEGRVGWGVRFLSDWGWVGVDRHEFSVRGGRCPLQRVGRPTSVWTAAVTLFVYPLPCEVPVSGLVDRVDND